MAKLTRKTLEVFANNTANIGQFGSAQVGTKLLTTDPETIQALAAYANGWDDAVISGERLPTLEEMNGLFYLLSYMIVANNEAGV